VSSGWLYECSHRNSNHSRPHNDGHHHWQQTPHTTRAPPTPSFLQGPTLDQKWKWTQSLCNHNQWSHPWCPTQCSFHHNISHLKSHYALAFLSADGERGSVWCSKIAGNCDVSKLQIILLFKANLISSPSLLVKKWWPRQKPKGWLAEKQQYGSQKSTITQCLNKRLVSNLIWQFKWAAITCSNDAKSCYDCIVHHITALFMFRCGGIPK